MEALTILSTSHLDAPLLLEAEQAGIRMDVLPFIRIESTLHADQRDQIHAYARRAVSAVFTSQNAVRIVMDELAVVPDWDVYCIRGATSRRIRAFGVEESRITTAPNGLELACLMLEKPRDREVVFFCGEQRLDVLPQKVSAHFTRFNELPVYRTIATPHRVSDEYDGVFFYSPSEVHSYFFSNPASSAVFFAIGETTATAIRSYAGRDARVVTASKADKREMIHRAINYFNKKKK